MIVRVGGACGRNRRTIKRQPRNNHRSRLGSRCSRMQSSQTQALEGSHAIFFKVSGEVLLFSQFSLRRLTTNDESTKLAVCCPAVDSIPPKHSIIYGVPPKSRVDRS